MKKTKTDLQIKKDKIRKEILAKRNILSDKDINKKSDLIIKNLASYIENIQNIMIFMDMKTEVKITKLLELYPKKNFFISKITNSKNREMKINKYNKNELILHKYWILSSFLLLPLILRKIGLGLAEDIMTLFWKKSERKIIKLYLLEFVMIFR